MAPQATASASTVAAKAPSVRSNVGKARSGGDLSGKAKPVPKKETSVSQKASLPSKVQPEPKAQSVPSATPKKNILAQFDDAAQALFITVE